MPLGLDPWPVLFSVRGGEEWGLGAGAWRRAVRVNSRGAARASHRKALRHGEDRGLGQDDMRQPARNLAQSIGDHKCLFGKELRLVWRYADYAFYAGEGG